MSAQMPGQDGALVRSARAGQAGAREELGRRVVRSAYVFALQLTRNEESAKDIAQDSVLRFFQHLDRFDADRAIEPWLYGIVRNRARDVARRDRLRQTESLDTWLEHERLETADRRRDPALETERAELRRDIWKAVSRLSEDHREIFILRDHHDLSYRAIAKILRIPHGTVMSRLHAARQNLRALLTEGATHD